MKKFLTSFKESSISILPIVIVILVLALTIAPLTGYDISKLLVCALFLIIGMGFFSIGAESSMLDIGVYIGGNLSKSRKIWLFVCLSFILGFFITLAEPDLAVLASQVGAINKWLFMCVVAVGVGITLSLAVLRIIFQIKISTVLLIAYSIVILLMFFVPEALLPVSIDSGAVTTGAISVPFILSFGLGVSAVRGGSKSEDDSFGLIALSSVGPIITTLIMSLFIDTSNMTVSKFPTVSSTGNFGTLFSEIGSSLLENLGEIALILLPILIFFFIYNFIYLKLPKSKIIKIIIGIVYTYFGIVIFLTGVFVGFMPIASVLGFEIADSNLRWLLYPISAIIGFVIILAEPAVHVLNKQVEEITNGIISKKVMMISICLGVGLSLILIILRVLFNINFLYIIVPIYAICIILCLFVPNVFVSVAFDSGGVASGAMAASFVLPFICGVCQACGINIMVGAFGTVALIATMPILIILLLGAAFKIISNKQKTKQKNVKNMPIEIIEFDIGDIE